MRTSSTSVISELESDWWALFLADRQHRRPHWKLPRDTTHRLEGLLAPALRSAWNCGVCCGGSGGVPEETGEEQEVLLRSLCLSA